MNAPIAPHTQQRCRKTRSRNVSSLPALVLSSLPVSEIELTPGKEHMVCPDCSTWCPITGVCGTAKLVPHHTEPTGNFEPRRCRSSNRRIILDVSVERWRRQRAEGTAETASRRGTRVLRKPQVPATTPVHRLERQSRTLIAASTHRRTCRECTETSWCAAGLKLAEIATAVEQVNVEVEQMAARQAREQRPLEWAMCLPAVRAADRSRLPVAETLVMPLKSATLPAGTPTTATTSGLKCPTK